MSTELKPCPFCGEMHASICARNGLFFVMCDKCTAEGPAMEGVGAKDDAAKEWNRRASSPAAVPEGALPPLPKSEVHYAGMPIFNPEQMQAYARAAVEADRAQHHTEAFAINAHIWKRESTQEWVLELSGELEDVAFTCRHTEPLTTPLADVPGLPTRYSPVSADRAQQGEPADYLLAELEKQVDFIANGEAGAPFRVAYARNTVELVKMIRAATKAAAPDDAEIAMLARKLVQFYPESLPDLRCDDEPTMRKLVEACRATPAPATGIPTCTYPKCNCPFDAPSDPNWCARGLAKAGD